jgi:small conductance mechanosensitive channel
MKIFNDVMNYLINNAAITDWLISFAMAVATFLIGRWVAHKIAAVITALMLKRGMEETLIHFLAQVIYAILMTIVIITSLSTVGVPLTSVAAIVGAAGLAIGLALKDSLSNFAQGVMLVLFQPFKKGDFVEAGGVAGTVQEVRIFSTVLKTGDNKQVIIPNGIIGGATITNYSVNDTRRIDFLMGVSYDDDLKVARDILTKVCADNPLVLDDPKTNIFVMSLGASSVDFAVRPWVKTVDYWAAYGQLLESFKVELEAGGCHIPYPQTDVHFHKVES